MRRRFTDPEVVTLLLSNDTRQHDQALADLYRTHGPTIIHLIAQQRGSREDGEEVISDALVGFLTNVRAGTFQLQPNTKISTYLCTLAKYNWLKRLRKDKPWLGNTRSIDDLWMVDLPQEEPVADERQDVFRELVGHLTGKCRALLEAVVEGFSMQEIALMLELGNADNAKAHKYNCMKKLDALRTKQP